MRSLKFSKGFTLLEIIIALFIFSIVSVILVGALHHILAVQAATREKALRLSSLQMALLLLSRDIEQIVPRPVLLANGKKVGFIGTSTALSFTHAGIFNPLAEAPCSSLERTRYEFKKNSLIRTSSTALDSTANTKENSLVLLTDVAEIYFQYLDEKNAWHSFWPPLNQPYTLLPRAVRFTLSLTNWGTLQQFYIIPGTSLEKPV